MPRWGITLAPKSLRAKAERLVGCKTWRPLEALRHFWIGCLQSKEDRSKEDRDTRTVSTPERSALSEHQHQDDGQKDYQHCHNDGRRDSVTRWPPFASGYSCSPFQGHAQVYKQKARATARAQVACLKGGGAFAGPGVGALLDPTDNPWQGGITCFPRITTSSLRPVLERQVAYSSQMVE